MPNTRPSQDSANLHADSPARVHTNAQEIDRASAGEGPGAMRDRAGTVVPNEYQDAGDPDPVLVALLLPAVGEAPRDGTASVWDDTDIVHVLKDSGTQIVGDWNGDGRDTAGVTASRFANTTLDDEAGSTLLDLNRMGAHEPLGVTVPLGSGNDSVEPDAFLDELDGSDF